MEDFLIRALLVGVGIAMVSGALGSFVIWKRMSYFSESIAHSSLLGVALGLASGLGLQTGLLIVASLFAVMIVIAQNRRVLSNDAILGIFSHIALSLGVIVLSVVGNANTDYFALLFGDILSVSPQDIVWVYVVVVLVFALLYHFWQKLLLMTLDEEMAVASGLNKTFYQLLLMLLIALTVSVSVQMVGVLLITSLLIIPPAVARVMATSPVSMLLLSIVTAMIAVLSGLVWSINYDVATGPAIVVSLGVFFIASQLLSKRL